VTDRVGRIVSELGVTYRVTARMGWRVIGRVYGVNE
jgi:hypothetical protein